MALNTVIRPFSLEDHLWFAIGADVFSDFEAGSMLPGLQEYWSEAQLRVDEAAMAFQDAVLKIQRGMPYEAGDYELAVFQACRSFAAVVVREFAGTMNFVYKSPMTVLPKLEVAVAGAASVLLREFFLKYAQEEDGVSPEHYLPLLTSHMKLCAREAVRPGTVRPLDLAVVTPAASAPSTNESAGLRADWFQKELDARGWGQADFLRTGYLDPKTLRRYLRGVTVNPETRVKIAKTFNSKCISSRRLKKGDVP